MTANINPETGIAYGYIATQCLDSDLVSDLMYGNGRVQNYRDLSWEYFCEERERETLSAFNAEFGRDPASDESEDTYQDDQDWLEMACQDINDACEYNEPEFSGELDGVKYVASWLGGALNLFILESPHVTDKARRASPCVPNAGILDTLDGSVTAYDVPADWRATEND